MQRVSRVNHHPESLRGCLSHLSRSLFVGSFWQIRQVGRQAGGKLVQKEGQEAKTKLKIERQEEGGGRMLMLVESRTKLLK